jgi:subtilisin family serine protease
VVPNDPLFGQLSGLKRGDFRHAWNVSDGAGAVIAVIDSGCNHHADLEGQVLWDYALNAIDGGKDVTDSNGHGTHVAGTIGASWDNNLGVAGGCRNCKILPCKFIGSNGAGSLFNAIKCINHATTYAQQHGPVAINASWGGGGYSQPMYDSLKRAADSNVLFIAAAGNEGRRVTKNAPAYPASYEIDNIISVAAIDAAGSLASFSNRGKREVDIAATGVSVLSLKGSQEYIALSGTSMATPHVAAAAALLLSKYPSLGIKGLRKRIFKNARVSESLRGKVARGRELDAFKMLQANNP